MTTKTRAELLSAKEEIERQLDEMPDMQEWKGTHWLEVKTSGGAYPGGSLVEIKTYNRGCKLALIAYSTALIPAADMIPRAEHERLIAEATSLTKIHTETAVARLVEEYALDWDFEGSEFEPQTYTRDVGTVKYSVVVSRTCDAPIKAYISPELDELLNRPMPARMNAPVAVPDAQPECWVNISDNGYYYGYKSKGEAEMYNGTCKLPSFPLYRHPAPPAPAQPVAVASQSVVDELHEIAGRISQWTSVADLDVVIAKITPLPEPDKFWLERMERHKDSPCVLIQTCGHGLGVGISDIPGFCAALIAKGSEVEAGK